MKTPDIDNRLAAAGALVRRGVYLADIGTDHAYLPIYLYLTGKIRGAVAADINEGPLARAAAHIEAYGCAEQIQTARCDGLCGIERYAPNDILICGMGGELIRDILSRSAYVKNPDIHLILQPMTAHSVLRQYLWENGFCITAEHLAKTDRVYQLLEAVYTGENTPFTAPETVLGKESARSGNDITLYREFLTIQRRFASERMTGKQKGGMQIDAEVALIEAIDAIFEKLAEQEKENG